MLDARVTRLAEILVRHSVRVAAGERVLIEAFDMPPEVVACLVEAVAGAGGVPVVD